MIREVLPEFDFVFATWVPQCCGPNCQPTTNASYMRDVPLFAIDSGAITGGRNYTDYDHEEYRELVWNFRDYIIERTPGGHGPSKHIYISRSEEDPFVTPGNSQFFPKYGCERRCLNKWAEEELVQAMNDTAAGVQVVHLSGMPFEKQVQIHREASVVVGVHGAAFLHCLWMPPNSSIIELGPEDERHFKWLCNEIMGLDRRFYQTRLGSGQDERDLVFNVTRFMSEEADILQ